MVNLIVFGLRNSEAVAKEISKKAKAEYGSFCCEKFPDGELHLGFAKNVRGKKVVLVQTMNPEPNDALVELIFAAETAKELGAKKVVAVVPYLAYMRQDKRFNKGECISAKEMAKLLNRCLDSLITIDPHLHRIKNLKQIFSINTVRLSADSLIADYVKKNYKKEETLLVGPDIESSQWAKKIADCIGFKSTIFLKERLNSRNVKIKVKKELEWEGKNVVIIDDIVSTGHTMIEAVKEIMKRKVKSVDCICVHAIMAENAFEKLEAAGARKIISCNTIKHRSNSIDVSSICAEAIMEINKQ